MTRPGPVSILDFWPSYVTQHSLISMWGRLRLRWTKMFVITQSQDGNCKCHKTGEKVTGGTGVMVLFCSSTAPHTHIWISLMTCRSEGSSSRARTEQSKYHHCFIQIYFYISILYYTSLEKWEDENYPWIIYQPYGLYLCKSLWIVERGEPGGCLLLPFITTTEMIKC